jgi:hypothetical protein
VRANHNTKILLTVLLLAGFLARIGPVSSAGPSTAGSGAAGLLARFAATTKGSVAHLRSIRKLTTVSTRMGEQSVTTQQRVEMIFPDRIRRTILTGDEEQAIVINAGQGFLAADGLTLPLPEGRLDEAAAQLGRDLLLLATSVGQADLQATDVGSYVRGGTNCQMVEITRAGVRSRLCLDERGVALSQSFVSRHPMSSLPGTIEILFEDYRETGGVLYPYRQRLTFQGEEIVTVTVVSLEINPDLPDALFQSPSPE